MRKIGDSVSISDFNKGLFTSLNIFQNEKGHSPDCVDVKWNFDGSIQKRTGSNTMSTISLTGISTTTGWTIDSSGTLSNNIVSYWKLDETSSTRYDSIGTNHLTPINNPTSASGIRGLAAKFVAADTQSLYINNSSLDVGTSNYTVSCWIKSDTFGLIDQQRFLCNMANSSGFTEGRQFQLGVQSDGTVKAYCYTTGGATALSLLASSFGAINTATLYHVLFSHSYGSHVSLAVNNMENTALLLTGLNTLQGVANFVVGSFETGGETEFSHTGLVDEIGVWNRYLTSQERTDLYGGGTGNTYSAGQDSLSSWGIFDFGASGIRWLVTAAGTGLYASSNLGVTSINIATDRSANYQHFERSQNVMIATSDKYDHTLYWAGSLGTYCSTLAPNSAPSARFAVNFQGFLILLNYTDSNGIIKKRGFTYADDSVQLTDDWNSYFELPSSDDDEITVWFTISKTLYVSTKYKLFRISFVGGNPDWSFQVIKDWGFVPRTVRKITLKDSGGEVVVGMDWNRRIRVFDGVDDLIISDNIESNNEMSDFSLSKVSFAGSGLVNSHAVVDPLEQEYRLNVVLGNNSTQTTHAIILNGRTMAFYPYANQPYQAMTMAESANRQFLMAVDRSGYIHMLNTGNTDSGVPIDEHYDSPFMFKKNPSVVTKASHIDLFFNKDSSGTIYVNDRADYKNYYSSLKKQITLTNANSQVQQLYSFDVPSVHNVYQFRIASSANTANPWRLTHVDYYFDGIGIGKGVVGP